MYNKKLKFYSVCALAMALTIAATPASVFAAEAGEATPATGSALSIDPTAEDDPSTPDENEGYADTDIDVWAFTENETIYSVDVEWGAMTFQYEGSSWDPDEHKSVDGRGWLVYDNTNSTALGKVDEVQNAINRVTITNHSNANVYAALKYTSGTDYADTTGAFAASTNASTEDKKATWNDTDSTDHSTGYFTLQTAATDATGQTIADPTTTAGTASVGNVYFKPNGIGTDQTIDQWKTIGKITVTITTSEPASTPAP